jgi:hypothetical protein
LLANSQTLNAIEVRRGVSAGNGWRSSLEVGAFLFEQLQPPRLARDVGGRYRPRRGPYGGLGRCGGYNGVAQSPTAGP